MAKKEERSKKKEERRKRQEERGRRSIRIKSEIYSQRFVNYRTGRCQCALNWKWRVHERESISCGIEEEIITGAKAYMRYSGQGWEIPVTLQSIEPSEITEKNFQNAFEEQYKLLFGRLVQGPDIEITVWSLNASAGHFSEKVIKVTEAKDESEPINTG